MGIYDRDYYRREGPSFLDAISRTGQVCKWLLLVNAGIFILQVITLPRGDELFMGKEALGPITGWLELDTAKVFSGEVWRLLSYAFLHHPHHIFHIVFNMLFLWWLGSEMEGIYGSREFLTFYLVAAVLGGVAFQAYAGIESYRAVGSVTAIPRYCLGASGAVTAVMVLFACHFPNRIIYLFFMIPVPMWAFVGFCVLVDTFYLMGGAQTTTAVVVHLGGAAFGFGYYKLQWRLSPLWTWIGTHKARRSRPRLRVYAGGEEATPEPVQVAAPPAGGTIDEQLEAKLDAVLEKVARTGQASLTQGEREILFRASEIYKKRRT
jgi:membrane associated rhomboid family serine protease